MKSSDKAAAEEDYRSGTALRADDTAAKSEWRLMLLSVAVAVVLLGVKLAAYVVTGSAAVFSDALEGTVNVVAGLFGLYAIWLAHRPADPSHPYGHGKVEFFSAGLEGSMILLAAVATVVMSLGVLLGRSDRVEFEGLGLGIALVVSAMAVNGALGGVLIRAGNRRGSPTLRSDGWHLLTDALTSAVALASLVIVRLTGWQTADPLLAIAVSMLIGWTGFRLLRGSFDGLMDRRDDDDDAAVRAILQRHVDGDDPRICGYHKVRSRHAGRYHWVDFHILIPASWDVRQGHETASRIEFEIEQTLGEGNATAHVEPCADPSCRVCAGPVRAANIGLPGASGGQSP